MRPPSNVLAPIAGQTRADGASSRGPNPRRRCGFRPRTCRAPSPAGCSAPGRVPGRHPRNSSPSPPRRRTTRFSRWRPKSVAFRTDLTRHSAAIDCVRRHGRDCCGVQVPCTRLGVSGSSVYQMTAPIDKVRGEGNCGRVTDRGEEGRECVRKCRPDCAAGRILTEAARLRTETSSKAGVAQPSEHHITKPFPGSHAGQWRACAATDHVLPWKRPLVRGPDRDVPHWRDREASLESAL